MIGKQFVNVHHPPPGFHYSSKFYLYLYV